MNILIVEDCPTQLEFLRINAELAFPTSSIIGALSIEEGLNIAQTLTTKDIVLLDLVFDNSSPEETLSVFSDVMKKLPVIIVTGVEDKDYAELAKAAGANNYLEKPITQETMRVHILQAIQAEAIKVVSEITNKTITKIEDDLIKSDDLKALEVKVAPIWNHEIQ